MELKKDSIRETIQKEGINSAKSKFKIEDITNELKKDFELVKGILSAQPSSAYNYCIYELLPSEVSHSFEKEILEFWSSRVMQETPNLNKEEVITNLKKDFDKSVVRKEYTEKGDAYQALYRRMEFIVEKYGQEKVDSFLKTEDPKLRKNLIEWGRIKKEVPELEVEEPPVAEEPPKVEEPPKAEEPPKVEEKTIEEPPVAEKLPKVEEKPIEELPVVEEPPVKKEKKIDVEKLSLKAKKLIMKVKALGPKCENERNIVKKHLLRFKLRMLISRLQEEIDLYYLKEEYTRKQEEQKTEKDEKQDNDIEEDIIKINRKMKLRKEMLSANSEYDYYSPDFMFPRSLVEECGGIEKYAQKLQASDKTTKQDAGKRIAGMLLCREQIKMLKKQMEDVQKSVEAQEQKTPEPKEEMDLVEDGKRMVLKVKNNIFKKMTTFFENVKISIQDFRTELTERRTLKAEYKQKEEELRQQFDLKMKELKEEAEMANNLSAKRSDLDFIKRTKYKETEETTNTKPENIPTEQPKEEPVEHSEH